jgi:hypothetical protein
MNLEPLTVVAARNQVDYQRARALIIRGEVEGELRGTRWFCSGEGLRRWKESQTQPAPAA